MGDWIVVLLTCTMYILVSDVLASVNKTKAQKGCTPAYAVISSSILSQHCIPYQYSNSGYCKHIIKWNVNSSIPKQSEDEDSLQRFKFGKEVIGQIYKFNITARCSIAIDALMCRYYYPRCDISTTKLQAKPLCRESCENVMNKLCKNEIEMGKLANKELQQAGYPFYWDLIDCDVLPRRNGGDAPECFYSRTLNNETDKLKSKECYYGNGLGYHGNVSKTQSGHVCQSWSSQCPHRHRHPLAEYPELVSASNYCRNPGGQGPNGPWCYTTNRNKRWEYCDVKKCPDPGPSLSPVIQTAYSHWPNKIVIQWRPVRLPYVHGIPQGFKIRLDRHGINAIVYNITSPNVTRYEAKDLLPLTKYNISILEYNENNDGPWSAPFTVGTMPEYSMPIGLTIIMKNKKFSQALLNPNKPRYKRLEKQVKSILTKLLRKTHSEGYNIFAIHILRFWNMRSKEGVGAELNITAELMNVTKWSVAQSIAGKIQEDMKNKSDRGLSFSSLQVKASPPPLKASSKVTSLVQQ